MNGSTYKSFSIHNQLSLETEVTVLVTTPLPSSTNYINVSPLLARFLGDDGLRPRLALIRTGEEESDGRTTRTYKTGQLYIILTQNHGLRKMR